VNIKNANDRGNQRNNYEWQLPRQHQKEITVVNTKVLIGSAMAAVLLGLGVLAGSVAGTGNASAQTPSTTPAAAATPGTGNSTTPANPPMGMPRGRDGMMGGRGHGGDFDGRAFGGATADGATQAITNATSLITLVKSDLAYATGKMDTTDVQRWVTGANDLLKNAQSANSSSQYGKAVAYAQAARELAMVADSQMAQKLGAANLPSYSQMPQRPDKGMMSTGTTVTQAQASRILAETYNHLVGQAAVVKSASNASEATPYLTDAQNAYKTAYDAYQAGKYSDAVASARLADKLSGVAEAVARASTAPANADTPVTVPAPNF
jgi:hypothetical protein